MLFKINPTLCGIWIIFIGVAYGDVTRALNVNLTQHPGRDLHLGDTVQFICDINRGMAFVTNHHIEYVLKPLGEDCEIMLAQTKIKKTQLNVTFDVDIIPVENNGIHYILNISGITDHFRGQLICQVRTFPEHGDKLLGQDSQEISLPRPLDVFRLKFHDLDAISKDKEDPIEVDSGDYNITCTAEGSYPAPDVMLILNGMKVLYAKTKTEPMDTRLKTFRTITEARIHVYVTQTIECAAQSQLDDNRSIKLPIKLKLYDPVVACNESQAHVGTSVILTCTVEYVGFNITSFSFQQPDGSIISEGSGNVNFAEVRREALSENKVRVHLKLKETNNMHFSRFYLLVHHADGHVTKESVRLTILPGQAASKDPGNRSTTMSPLSPLLLLIVVFVVITEIGDPDIGQALIIKFLVNVKILTRMVVEVIFKAKYI